MNDTTCNYCIGSQIPEACEQILNGMRTAKTAAELMQARYAAFATHHIDFLYASAGPEVQKEFDEEASRRWAESSEWKGFEILATEAGGENDTEGVVEFVAHYNVNGTDFDHHERSLFRKIDGEWKFIDGELVKTQPIRRETPRVGRNDPCPCGSGKKYKKCCGK